MRLCIFLLFAILFSGCAQNYTKEDRLACLEITSYAFTQTPNCATQDKCFSEVEKYFGNNSTSFNYNTSRSLFDAKNHLARSWLFISSARSNLKIIHEQCYQGNNFPAIPRQANELRANLLEASEEIDLFNENAILALSYQLSYLESQDINLVSNEPLFADYIMLHQNIVDYSQANTSQNSSFASKFLAQTEKFNSLSGSLSLQKTIPESTILDIIAQNKRSISKETEQELLKRNISIPFISPFIEELSEFLSQFLSITGSVNALGKLPAFEILGAFDAIAGSKNSAASSFFETFQSIEKNTNSLDSKNLQTELFLQSEFSRLEDEVQQISQNIKFNESEEQEGNFFSITSSPMHIIPRSDFESHFTWQINELKSRLRILEQKEATFSSTLGELSFSLLQLEHDTLKLGEDINANKEYYKSYSQTCFGYAKQIKTKLSGNEYNSSKPSIIALKERLVREINSLTENDLRGCFEAISSFSKLTEYLEQANPDQLRNNELQECINHTEKLLEFSNNQEHKLQLESLKRILQPYTNPDLVVQACQTIKSNVKNEIYLQENLKNLEQKFSELESFAAILQSISEQYPENSPKAMQKLRSFPDFSEKFENGKLRTEFLENSQELLQKITVEVSETKSMVSELLPKIVANNSEIEVSGNITKISLYNRAIEIPVSFDVELDVNSNNSSEIYSTKNIVYAPNKGKTQFRFLSLLHGHNSIVLEINKNKGDLNAQDSNTVLEILSEKIELISNLPDNQDPEIKMLAGKIDFYAANNMLSKAAEALFELKNKADEQENIRENNISRQIGILQQTIGEILLYKERTEKNILLLEENYSNLSDEELLQVHAFAPITKQRIRELKEQMQRDFSKIQELGELLLKNEHEKAIELAQKIHLSDIKLELSFENEELNQATEKLQENAISSYNSAVKIANSTTDPLSEQLMQKSKQSLENKSYLESILHSSKVSATPQAALVTAQTDQALPALYLLVGVVILIGAFAFFKSAKNKGTNEQEKTKINKFSEEIEGDGG